MRPSNESNHHLGAWLSASILSVMVARGNVCGDVFVSPESFSDVPPDVIALVFPEGAPETPKCMPFQTAVSNAIPQELLQKFEQFDPVQETGVFLYFPHRFSGMDETVYVCQFDHWKSGGSFLGCVISNGTPHGVGCAIDRCEHWEWYRLGTTSGETNLAVVAIERFGDGNEHPRYDRERFLALFRNESGRIVKSAPYRGVGELIGDPRFAFLERPDIFVAKRGAEGNWTSSPPDDPMYSFSKPLTVPNGSGKADDSFPEYLRATWSAVSPKTQVVFECSPDASPFFALVTDGMDENGEGFLWAAFLHDSSGWKPAPENGFACASGWCPAAFRAKATDFFKLYLCGEQPRLVVAENHDGRIEELFWREAVAKKPHRFDFRNGYPSRHYMSDFGMPQAPTSFFQSLDPIPFSPFQRLERIAPTLVSPETKSSAPPGGDRKPSALKNEIQRGVTNAIR